MKARISTPYAPQLYTGFTGLSTARGDVSLERPEAQPLIAADNLYASNKGYLTNEPPAIPYGASEKGFISHLRQRAAGSDVAVYAVRVPGGTSLRAIGSAGKAEAIWPRSASVCSAVFNGNVVLAAGQDEMRRYDGFEFKPITSPGVKGGRYLCAVQNRLVVAGFDAPGRENELAISRVNNPAIHYTDEMVGEPSVLQAARLNIGNLVQGGDRVRGMGAFESGKLAIFTDDRALIYTADPDYTKWALDTTAQVNFGTVSHKSIVSVAGEIFFCSRAGVHSLRRSMLNGANVFTTPMSEDITELYQSLLAKVRSHKDISAYYNADEGRLHIFFPVNDLLSYRLSAALSLPQTEQETTRARWSLSTSGGLTCGDHLAGRTLVGSISGMREVLPWYSEAGDRGDGETTLPPLYHQDLFNPKRSLQLVLYASGAGRVFVDAHDETGRELGAGIFFDLPDADQADYHGVPLQRQFTRPFSHSYSGLRLRLRVRSKRQVRIFAVGVLLKKEE